jgi:hypothetical protein
MPQMIFYTISGSIYEIDENRKQIRRLHGNNEPTSRQGKNGNWKKYATISDIAIGKPVIIVWEALTFDRIKTTMTSAVEKVSTQFD